jgi:DedD protein
MSLLSIFSKKPAEATSVEEALAGTTNPSSIRSKNRKSDKTNAESEQLIPERKRARRRLIGAVVMVLAVVIGLPLVLDSEPKAVNKNIAIQIPSRDESAVLSESREQVAQSDLLEQESKKSSSSPATEVAAESAPTTPKAEEATAALAATTGKSKTSEIAAVKESKTKKADESARALAILNGTNSDSAKAAKPAKRIVVQVGAFATREKVNEVRGKLTSAGIKSYTQKVATNSGDKIRVRVGPFDDKESAEKIKAQLEKLGINSSLLTL